MKKISRHNSKLKKKFNKNSGKIIKNSDNVSNFLNVTFSNLLTTSSDTKSEFNEKKMNRNLECKKSKI